MSFTLNRSFLIGRRHLIQSTLRCLYSTDNNDPKDSKGDLAQLLLKMKDTQSKPKMHLKAQPSRKIAPQEDSDSSSSSSDSSSDDEIILDKETIRITDRVAVEKANEANLDEDGTLALKRSINDDLARKLKAIKNETKTARRDSEVSGSSGGSMEQLLSNMKIQKTKLEKPQRSNIVDEVELTPEQKRFLAERRMLRENRKLKQEAQDHEPIDLLNAEQPLKIFNTEKYSDQFTLDSWKAASIRELQILRTQPPRNLIEDMVSMTEKGILWHFPIDNEQGINANEIESFVDHVFLEHHLEPWCPPAGPVREFMEVVCVTLSKNAFMTGTKKKEYIDWFQEYFNRPDPKEILKISGAIE